MRKVQHALLRQLRSELEALHEPAYQEGVTRFFKEPVQSLGVRTPRVRALAKRYWNEQVRDQSTEEVLHLCEALLDRGTLEEGTVALAWAARVEPQLTWNDAARLEQWVQERVTNWAHCDDFCTHALGAYVARYPQMLKRIASWRVSPNRWMRRASAVVLVYPWTKPNPFLAEILETAEVLLQDPDDMVQKGYGWMLKVASKFHTREVVPFVLARKASMPRTAFRYAIELWPPALKQQAMQKESPQTGW